MKELSVEYLSELLKAFDPKARIVVGAYPPDSDGAFLGDGVLQGIFFEDDEQRTRFSPSGVEVPESAIGARKAVLICPCW